jgi:hypothetical protein
MKDTTHISYFISYPHPPANSKNRHQATTEKLQQNTEQERAD